MKAAYIEQTGPPENITVGDLPRPEPGPGQVLVKVHAVALNPIDLYIRSGMVAFPLAFPYVIGCDLAGTVEEVGPGCKRFKVGDRVWGSNQGLLGRQGVASEFAAVGEEWLYPTPDPLARSTRPRRWLWSGSRPTWGSSASASSRRARRFMSPAAAGGVGSMVVQMAKAAGARVATSAGSAGTRRALPQPGRRPRAQLQVRRHPRPAPRVRSRGIRRLVRDPARAQPEVSIPLLRKHGRMILMAGRTAKPALPLGAFYPRNCSLLRLRHVQRHARRATALRPRHHPLGRGGPAQADCRPDLPAGLGGRGREVPRGQHRGRRGHAHRQGGHHPGLTDACPSHPRGGRAPPQGEGASQRRMTAHCHSLLNHISSSEARNR